MEKANALIKNSNLINEIAEKSRIKEANAKIKENMEPGVFVPVPPIQNKELVSALCKFNQEIGEIKQSKFIKYQGTKAPYSSIDDIVEAIKAPLSNNGLVIQHTTSRQDTEFCVVTTLYHVSGGSLSSKIVVRPDSFAAQKIGAAYTYCRRYNLNGLLNLGCEVDDDGNTADGKEIKEYGNNDKKEKTIKPEPKLITKAQAKEIESGLIDSDSDFGKFFEAFGISKLPELPANQYKRAMSGINKKLKGAK